MHGPPARVFAFLVFACLGAAATAPSGIVVSSQPRLAARYLGGALPAINALAVGGGEVLIEATVDANGVVMATDGLRSTPPFTDNVRAAVRQWIFTPAREQRQEAAPGGGAGAWMPVTSRVLIAAVFRPPAVNTPTLGDPPRDLFRGSPSIPHPAALVPPSYPPLALFGGIVLVEVLIGPAGDILDSRVIRSASPFDQPALDAVRQWRFQPALIHGVPTSAYAYVIVGFQQPVTGTR